jgi:transposase
MKASLSAMRNKTDRNDARGIAQMMRVGLFRVVHVKSRESHELRLLLTNRSVLRRKTRRRQAGARRAGTQDCRHSPPDVA